MADDRNNKRIQEGNYENRPSPVPEMSSENRPPSVNRITPSKDSYWFSHGGVDEVTAANARGENKSTADVKDVLLQKEREERIRLFREQQEEERIKRLKELEQSFVLSKKFREQQEEDRRRKIEDARVKEIERRQQVEERKRQIWEAEQERKEAILRRNLEREARIEARRNAQRNSLCFAFGSSTPRSFDLDLAALGNGRNSAPGFSLMTAISGRQSEERDFGTKRTTSSCSLDRKSGEDCMSRSMVSLSSVSRGRRRTDLIPTAPRERSATPHSVPRGNPSMRAVSMTRLDQLAQPRRRYFEAARDNSSMANGTTTGPCTVSPSMSKSMCNLSNSILASHPPKKLSCAPTMRRGNMSRSMLHLPESSQQHSPRLTPSPTSPPFYGKPSLTMRSAQSMTHLAIAPPRLTRAARLRADALANARRNGQTTSMLNLCKTDSYATGRLTLSAKDSSRSPSRPQSSMSGRSEISITSSQASAVSLRPKPAPRRPRPFSIAGTVVDRSTIATSLTVNKSPERQPRPYDRNVTTTPKPPRAKSVDPDNVAKTGKPTPPPKKPVPPPKTAEILAKAKVHSVPTKDNLRKAVKTPNGIVKDKLPDGHNMLPSSDGKQVPLVKSEITLPESAVVPSSASEPVQNVESEGIEINKSSVGSEVESESIKNPDVPSNVIESVEDIIVVETEVCAGEKKPELEILPQETTMKLSNSSEELTPSKPRITSEEEARAALAEKRRLAREQAEREAELERQQQEEIRLQEEEKKKQEELEQKRMEEEQIRLAELHRKLEEEKLKKAIEEQQQREKEEKDRLEEEARLKAEKDEQDKKAREEAEKQRIELEERLRKEEEERAERKRRVEQIMSRTRSKGMTPGNNSTTNSKSVSPVEDTKAVTPTSKQFGVPVSIPEVSQANGFKSVTNNNTLESESEINVSVTSSNVKENSNISGVASNAVSLLDSSNAVQSESVKSLDLDIISSNSFMKNGFHADKVDSVSKTNVSNVYMSNRTQSADKSSPMQTNGYSSHEETSSTSSPEDKSGKTDSSEGLLLDFDSHPTPTMVTKERMELDQLIDVGGAEPSTNLNNDNFLMNVDVVNSNLVSSGNPFIGFEDNLPKKQETTITDLLL